MSEKSKTRAAARAAKAAKKQAAKKQVATAKTQAATAKTQAATAKKHAASAPKKKTKVQITKREADQIGALTEENLRMHNFKYYPRHRIITGEPTVSSLWAKETVPLPFPIPWDIPFE